MEEQRREVAVDRRAHPRGGRRTRDAGRPWYLRRRLWLAIASLAFVGWKRMTHSRPGTSRRDVAA